MGTYRACLPDPSIPPPPPVLPPPSPPPLLPPSSCGCATGCASATSLPINSNGWADGTVFDFDSGAVVSPYFTGRDARVYFCPSTVCTQPYGASSGVVVVRQGGASGLQLGGVCNWSLLAGTSSSLSINLQIGQSFCVATLVNGVGSLYRVDVTGTSTFSSQYLMGTYRACLPDPS